MPHPAYYGSMPSVSTSRRFLREASKSLKRPTYAYATRVIIWLRLEQDGSELATEALQTPGSEVQVDWPTFTIISSSGEDYGHWHERSLPFMPNPDAVSSIARLLDRSWFTRLWNWQEIRLAIPEVELRCGRYCMPWETLRTAVLCFHVTFASGDPRFTFVFQRAFSVVGYARRSYEWEQILLKFGPQMLVQG